MEHRRMVGREEIPVLAEVGHDGDVPRVPVVAGVGDHRFELAEVAAEGDLRLVVEMLVAEDEDLVLVECFPDRAEILARHGYRQIDAGYLGDEKRMQALDGKPGLEHGPGSSWVRL